MTPVAVVTGAGQGIGRQVAKVLAQHGYALGLNDLRSPSETLAMAEKAGASVLELLGDVSDESCVQNLADKVKTKWGRIDLLVNNAGISCIAPAEQTSAVQFRRVFEVNLLGPFLLAKAFGAMMLVQGSGSIVNIASIAGLVGIADRVAYNASKHGLIGMTRTLAAEWGGRGVRCNAICPGWVKTPMDLAPEAAGLYTDADIEGRVPMGRFATEDDIAQAIAFLADSERSGFINGHTLSVDGGWFAD